MLYGRVARLIRPKTRTTPDEWGARNRVYPPTSGVPGPRDARLTPYVVAPIRAVHSRTHSKVVFVCGSQMGKTDGVLDIIGERFDTAPVPTIYLGPTKKFLEEQVEPRIMDLLDEAPDLSRKVTRGRRMRLTRKLISGVPLRLAHGGSSAALKSDPFGLAFTDEADEMMANVKGAGDPIRLVDKRGESYSDFVHYVTSTPTEGPSDVEVDEKSGLEFWAEIDADEIKSTIWRLWQSGTRYHWAWPCPHCGEYFIPRLKALKWRKPIGPDGKERPSDPALARSSAHFDCPRCGCEILDEHRADMNARGVYVAPGQQVLKGGEVVGDAPDALIVSYWVSGLASPFKSLGERAAEYVDAVRSGSGDEIQAVVNGSFGELYAPGAGDVPEWRELEALKPAAAPYVMGEVPPWTRFLTLACDVQGNRLVYTIRSWGPRGTSALVKADEIWGNTVTEDPWEQLDNIILDRFDGYPIRLALIDSGFRPGNPKNVPENRVYSFCSRHQSICRPTKGRHSLPERPIRPSKIEAKVNWRGRLERVGIEILLLDTDYFKRQVHEKFRWPADQPGAWLLPDDVPDSFLQSMVSEARIRKPGGATIWVRRSKENHFFDCEAMQAAAGWWLGAQRLTPRDDDVRQAESAPKKTKIADYAAALNG